MQLTQSRTPLKTLIARDDLSPVERVSERLLHWWSARSKAANVHILFTFLLAFLVVTVLFIGAVPTFKYGHDDFFFLENGWRALHGLRPQIDYWGSFGPGIFFGWGLGSE